MKFYRAFLACILAAGAAFAGVQIGLDLNLDLNPDIYTSVNTDPTITTRTRTTFGFGLSPTIGIRPGDLLEIAPSVAFGVSSQSTSTEYESASTVKSSTSQVGLGFGVAFLFHVIRKEYFELALGPQLSGYWRFEPSVSSNGSSTPSIYSSYYNSTEQLSIPLKFDFYFNRHFGLRVGTQFLAFTYNTHSYEYKATGSTPDVEHDLDFEILTSWMPDLGLFLRF